MDSTATWTSVAEAVDPVEAIQAAEGLPAAKETCVSMTTRLSNQPLHESFRRTNNDSGVHSIPTSTTTNTITAISVTTRTARWSSLHGIISFLLWLEAVRFVVSSCNLSGDDSERVQPDQQQHQHHWIMRPSNVTSTFEHSQSVSDALLTVSIASWLFFVLYIVCSWMVPMWLVQMATMPPRSAAAAATMLLPIPSSFWWSAFNVWSDALGRASVDKTNRTSSIPPQHPHRQRWRQQPIVVALAVFSMPFHTCRSFLQQGIDFVRRVVAIANELSLLERLRSQLARTSSPPVETMERGDNESNTDRSLNSPAAIHPVDSFQKESIDGDQSKQDKTQ